jgi:hypothetical protein
MPVCLTMHPDYSAVHGRFRFARAGQRSGCPVLLPGMLVRRSVVAPCSTLLGGSDPQGVDRHSHRSRIPRKPVSGECVRSWIHWDAGRKRMSRGGFQTRPYVPPAPACPRMFLSGVALTRKPCAGMRSCRRGAPLIKSSAARPQGKRCRDGSSRTIDRIGTLHARAAKR